MAGHASVAPHGADTMTNIIGIETCEMVASSNNS